MASCKICGRQETTMFGHPHECWEEFQVVWGEYVNPKNIDWDEASEVLDFTAEMAAEKYAEENDEDKTFIDDCVEVYVKDKKGDVTYWDVSAILSIDYRANQKESPNPIKE